MDPNLPPTGRAGQSELPGPTPCLNQDLLFGATDQGSPVLSRPSPSPSPTHAMPIPVASGASLAGSFSSRPLGGSLSSSPVTRPFSTSPVGGPLSSSPMGAVLSSSPQMGGFDVGPVDAFAPQAVGIVGQGYGTGLSGQQTCGVGPGAQGLGASPPAAGSMGRGRCSVDWLLAVDCSQHFGVNTFGLCPVFFQSRKTELVLIKHVSLASWPTWAG